jgi:hypothetical protein
MIALNVFKYFDPQSMDASKLPDKPGNYLVALRDQSQFPKSKISFTPKMCSIQHLGKEYWVIYTGKSSKSLRMRDFEQHFHGNAGVSTLRKSLGCLMEFNQIPRSASNPNDRKTKFSDMDEEKLTMWMLDNLILFYYSNVKYDSIEQDLIDTLNPPLNLQHNKNEVNENFRKALSDCRSCSVRSRSSRSQRKQVQEMNYQCPNCHVTLIIPDDMRNEKDIQCLSCKSIFPNPIYGTTLTHRTGCKKGLIGLIAIVIFLEFLRFLNDGSMAQGKAEMLQGIRDMKMLPVSDTKTDAILQATWEQYNKEKESQSESTVVGAKKKDRNNCRKGDGWFNEFKSNTNYW